MKSVECPFRRRGAPFTFDAENFLLLVQRLSSTPATETDMPESATWAPNFDHAIKDPVERDIRISSAQKVVLLEGSYLLLDEYPWCLIRELVSETYAKPSTLYCCFYRAKLITHRWFISVPRNVSKDRLIARHIAAGIESDVESAALRAETNDLLNWDLINENLLCPDVMVESK